MNQMLTNLFRVCACGLLLLFVAEAVHGQFKAGIQGTVTDSSGGLVPDATITLTDNTTGKSQTTNASGEGFYRITGLAPGSHSCAEE